MRFKVGDIVRVKKRHRNFTRNYGDGVVIKIYSGTDPEIRVSWQRNNSGRWLEKSLRLLRRANAI